MKTHLKKYIDLLNTRNWQIACKWIIFVGDRKKELTKICHIAKTQHTMWCDENDMLTTLFVIVWFYKWLETDWMVMQNSTKRVHFALHSGLQNMRWNKSSEVKKTKTRRRRRRNTDGVVSMMRWRHSECLHTHTESESVFAMPSFCFSPGLCSFLHLRVIFVGSVTLGCPNAACSVLLALH